MVNHVATGQPQNPRYIAVPVYSVHKTGEDWAHTNKTTGDVEIHPGQINVIMCPETGKQQEYSHLMKVPTNQTKQGHLKII